jgi:hypothetical protein
MLYEAGVEMAFFNQVVDVIMKDSVLQGVIAQGKGGRTTYMARAIIDCTGDAHIADLACVPMQPTEEALQPPSMVVRMENVHIGRLREYLIMHPQDYPSYRMKRGKTVTDDFLEKTSFFFALPDRISNIRYTGGYRPVIDRFMFSALKGTGTVYINMLRTRNTDCTDSESLSKATVICYLNLLNLMDGFRENVPGFEEAYLSDADPEIQIRETRRIAGEYTLTSDDVIAGRDFEDSIAVGSYFIDIHSSTDAHGLWKQTEKAYGIPYRTLVPQKIDGLLVAGRCISGDRMASASFRVMATCMAMGQAAGTAAALCIDRGVTFRELDTTALRYALAQEDAIVSVPR